MRQLQRIMLCGTMTAGAVLAVGCGSSNSGTPYPTGGSMADSPPPPTPMVTLPPNAQTLATGTFQRVSFSMPSEKGLLYIYDMDTQKVVATTNSGGENAGRSMTMSDLKNITNGLDTSHMYKIAFMPQHMSEPSSTMPATAS